MSTYRLDRLVAPRSLAVVGASPRQTSVGRHVIANIVAAGFAGPVHVVNPNHPEIEGIDTVGSIDAIAGTPDVVVIAVPPAAVPETVAAAGAKGAAAAIIITAGLGHGPGSLAEAAEHAARADRPAAGRPQLPRGAGAAGTVQCELRHADAGAGRSRRHLAIRRHRRRHDRMGGAARDRLLRRDFRRRPGRCRFRRPARSVRGRRRHPRHRALCRVHQGCPQVHVGGAGSGPGEAGDRHQGGPPYPGRQGRRDPHRRAGGLGRGL